MGYVEELMGEHEQIVIKTRQHWIVLARSFFFNAAAVVGILILVLALLIFAGPLVGPLAFLPLLLLLFPCVAFLRDFLYWWNEEYLVTNRRVIQVEGVFNKHVIDSSLEKVNDVVLNQSVAGRLMNYGDIEILTASEIGVNKLHRIENPVQFKTQMLNQKEALGTDEHFGARPGAEPDVPHLLDELDELHKRGVLTDVEFQQKKAELLAKM